MQGLLARISVETPVLLVIEDLQWADPSSRSLLLSTARQLPGTRVVLVGTFRSDDLGRRHPFLPTLALLERLPNVERIDLQRLDAGGGPRTDRGHPRLRTSTSPRR